MPPELHPAGERCWRQLPLTWGLATVEDVTKWSWGYRDKGTCWTHTEIRDKARNLGPHDPKCDLFFFFFLGLIKVVRLARFAQTLLGFFPIYLFTYF